MSRSRKMRTRRRPRGYTLVELLTVVFILLTLMDVMLPLYLDVIGDAQRKTCRANMQSISNAVEAARVKTGTNNYSGWVGAVTTAAEPDLMQVPVCPAGGAYSIATGHSNDNTTFKVSCTGVSLGIVHGTFEPGIDHK